MAHTTEDTVHLMADTAAHTTRGGTLETAFRLIILITVLSVTISHTRNTALTMDLQHLGLVSITPHGMATTGLLRKSARELTATRRHGITAPTMTITTTITWEVVTEAVTEVDTMETPTRSLIPLLT